MDRLPTRVLLLIAALIAAVGGVVGGLIALALDEPDVVVTQRVVEVPMSAPPALPSEDDLERLAEAYADATGVDSDLARGLLGEIGVLVCEDQWPTDEIRAALRRDLTMDATEFADFVEQVRDTCP